MTAAAAGDAFGSMSRGVAASAAGTLAMDVSLYRQYRRDGRRESFAGWETSEGLETWDHAPGPALAAKRVLGAMLGREIPARYVRLNNTTHKHRTLVPAQLQDLVGARQGMRDC